MWNLVTMQWKMSEQFKILLHRLVICNAEEEYFVYYTQHPFNDTVQPDRLALEHRLLDRATTGRVVKEKKEVMRTADQGAQNFKYT